ncbi:tRNA lysidine(34) synthetase TilS [Mucilaginibacter aquatilis]|nr:tRNA lysidine(34) synthetase TilS [Mucilaginibacter aquatilis]
MDALIKLIILAMLPVQRLCAFIDQNQLFTANSRILAAVSGGMDSVLLVHMLKQAGFMFAIAHCNFQLRGGEADADQQFCRQLALNLGVQFHTVNFDTQAYANSQKLSIQMAARELRYQWFEQVRQQFGYDAIALAHHQNDTIETILLNLTRGTGIAGLHGILPRNNYLVRPMLFLNRAEIAALVEQNKLHYVEDSSNASTKYARNKIRHEVVPKLLELNPGLEQTFERNVAYFRELEQLLIQQVESFKKQHCKLNGADTHISIDAVKQLFPQKLLLSALLKDYNFNDTAVDNIISSLDKHSGRIFESTSHFVILNRNELIISPQKKVGHDLVSIHEEDHEVSYNTSTVKITYDTYQTPFPSSKTITLTDAGLLVYPLTLRHWHEGDYFYPLGMKGRKKLSDFFINQKVPLHQKQSIPVLINGNGELIWIAGYRLDDRYKVTPQTKKVAIFELL